MLSGTPFDAVYHQFLAEKPATTRSTVNQRKPTEADENQRKRTDVCDKSASGGGERGGGLLILSQPVAPC